MRRGGLLAWLIAGAASLTPAFAVTPDEMLKDAALEGRARALSAELRCLVCQNQSIDESDAPLAHDIRVLLRERISTGDSDDAVMAFLVARYGEFILLKPPFALNTVLLWATPVAVLVIGAGVIVLIVRRRRETAVLALSVDEQAKLARIMGSGPESDG
jgi:cytochrome c-type biogenesis protein CcmH